MVANIDYRDSKRGVIITGCSGFLGIPMTGEVLSRQGFHVAGLVRGKSKEGFSKQYSYALEKGNLKLYDSDITISANGREFKGLKVPVLADPKNIEQLALENDYFVNCAGLVSFIAKRDKLYSVNVEGGKNVRELVKGINEVRRRNGKPPLRKFVYVSTAYVNDPSSGRIPENKLIPRKNYGEFDNYVWSKTESEKAHREAINDGEFDGTQVDIFRPGIIVGSLVPGSDHGGREMTFNSYLYLTAKAILKEQFGGDIRAFLEAYDARKRSSKIRLIGDPTVFKRFLFNDEVARRIVTLMFRSNDPENRTFHIVGEKISGYDVQQTFNDVLPIADFEYNGRSILVPTPTENAVMAETQLLKDYTLCSDDFDDDNASHYLEMEKYVPLKMTPERFTEVINRFVLSDVIERYRNAA